MTRFRYGIALASQSAIAMRMCLEAWELRQAFRQELLSDAKKVDGYLQVTRDGDNVSQMNLGWLAYSLLSELAERDPALNEHFRSGNRDVGSYLKHVFAKDPQGEVDTMDALARLGPPSLRLVARDMLLALRFIPDGNDPTDVQAKDRERLAQALSSLKANLERASAELM